MAAITQLEPSGIPGKRYNSFSGKGFVPPDGRLTQLSPSNIPMGRYGDFSGKPAAAGGGTTDADALLFLGWYGRLPFDGQNNMNPL